MNGVVSIYIEIMLEFLFELYLFYALTTYIYKRRRLFALRAVGGGVVMAGIAFGAAAVYPYLGGNVFGRIAIYFCLFLASTAHAKLCYEEKYRILLFACSVAYAAQNLVYKVFLLLWCFGERFDLFNWENYSLYYHLIYFAYWLAAAAAVYFLFLRRFLRRFAGRKLDPHMFAVTVMTLIVTLVLCSVEDINFAALSVGRETRYASYEVFVLREAGNAFSVVGCAFVLLLAYNAAEETALRGEIGYLEYAIRQGKLQYEISKDTIELIHVKCHDIKYRIGALANGASEKEIEDLKEAVSIYDSKVETGNPLLDVLLTEKSLFCEQNGITFSSMADGKRLEFMESGDLYCLFGNIIDNALEAVMKIKERERRVIDLVVKAKDGLLFVQADNYFDGELSFRDGLPVTTKDDENYHGFGTRSIRMIAKKYGGEMTVFAENGVFHLNLLFSLN